MGNTCFKGRIGIANRTIRLLMVGLDNAGKTCTAKSIVGETLDNVAPTVGFNKVQHKYKGFQITIYDLGGSKSFRGIWNKYYHEVHGFIFVIDSSDASRIQECKDVLREMLNHELVQGKPILLLCNKSDIDQAQDEMELVSQLEVETLVNAAQCPTRVEQCIASKGQGLKEGYKWLVKSVISKFVDIEGRVVKDSEKENKKEEVRRENARRRIEEKRRLQEQEEEGEGEEASNSEDICPPGFVPLDDLRKRWSTQDNPVSAASNLFSNGGKAVSNQFSNGNISTSNLFSNGGMTEKVRNGNSSPNGTHFSQLRLSDLPINGSNGKLELEPIHRPKKRSLLSKLQKTNTEIKSIKSIDSQISQAWSTAEDRGGIRNWGLAEEL